jgi:hypothetical protein
VQVDSEEIQFVDRFELPRVYQGPKKTRRQPSGGLNSIGEVSAVLETGKLTRMSVDSTGLSDEFRMRFEKNAT